MKGKSVVRLLLDTAMLVLFLLLTFDTAASAFFHEVAGIGVGLLFILHIVLDWGMFKGLIMSAKRKRITFQRFVLLILDLLLPLGMLTVIVTGLFISQALFPVEIGPNWQLLYQIHDIVSYACLGIIGMHLLLHLKYLVAVIRQWTRHAWEKPVLKAASGFFAAAMVLCLTYVIAYNAFGKGNVADLANAQISAAVSSAQESSTSGTPSTVKKKEESSSSSSSSSGSSSQSSSAAVSLNTFLSKLYCTGCHKHCPLSSPQCITGEQQAQVYTQQYDEEYGTSES